MKKMNFKISTGILMVLLIASSCNDFLDINENPNSPITADVQLVLPQAIVASANVANQFNTYGAHFGGFMANAGGFSGFGNLLSYNLTPGDWNGLWVSTYQDPLEDLKYVIDKTEGVDALSYFNAAAKIMTVVNYQRLVDAFGDIPYTDALRGAEGITAPTYDDGAAVYQALIAKLDEAINVINSAQFPLSLKSPTDARAYDPLFQGDIDNWKRYANTLKLRMYVRTANGAGASSLDLTLGFLIDDAIVNPGYEKNRPNPTWNSWGRSAADALSNSSRIPTTFSFAFYSGSKLTDGGRGETIYVNYPSTPTNQLGNEVNNPTIVSGQVTWASNQAGFEGTGVLKGPSMGSPLMLKAESEFLVAEAMLMGYIPGGLVGMRDNFYNGIKSSYAYLFEDETGAMKDTTGRVETYKTTNSPNKLVIIENATTTAERLEAIITQKYIAMNMITSDEAYNEYRRTGYPISKPGQGPSVDIASNKSTVTSRIDRLPTRILYPSSEQSFNSANFRAVDYASERIFWDPN
jgi:hypothetical protein